jgi:putative spermidine/putrescine transport system permease protein
MTGATGRVAVRLAVVAALLWLLVPLAPVLVWALTDRWAGRAALPQDLGASCWRGAVDAGLGPAVVRSLLLGVVVSALAMPLGALTGRLLGWGVVRRPRAVLAAVLLPVLLPPLAVAMGLDVVTLRLHVPGTLAVVAVLTVLALPFTTLTAAAGLARLGPGPEEQARTLGATPRQARWLVTWPALRRSLGVAAALAFLVGWGDYVVTLLLGGGQLVTLPVLLASSAAGSGNEPTTAVLALVAAAPAVLVLVAVGTVGTVLRARRRARRAPVHTASPAVRPPSLAVEVDR